MSRRKEDNTSKIDHQVLSVLSPVVCTFNGDKMYFKKVMNVKITVWIVVHITTYFRYQCNVWYN